VETLTEQVGKLEDRLRGTQTENHSIGERYGSLERYKYSTTYVQPTSRPSKVLL